MPARINDSATARSLLRTLARHGVEFPPPVADALDRADRFAKATPGREAHDLEREAGAALFDGDEKKATKLLQEAVLRPARGQALTKARLMAEAALTSAVRATTAEFAVALAGPAKTAIATVTAGAPIWDADPEVLVRQGRAGDAERLVAARAAEVRLVEIFRLRDQLLGLGPGLSKPWTRWFSKAGDWCIRGDGVLPTTAIGHPGRPGTTLLQSVATGGRLAYFATTREIEQNTARLDAEREATSQARRAPGRPGRVKVT